MVNLLFQKHAKHNEFLIFGKRNTKGLPGLEVTVAPSFAPSCIGKLSVALSFAPSSPAIIPAVENGSPSERLAGNRTNALSIELGIAAMAKHYADPIGYGGNSANPL